MGVYIPNMKKPKECGDCNFVQAFWDDKRWLFRCLVTDKIAEDCPLIEIVTCGECKHRDPEDKKCDSGMLERQGCIFPVDDDYFCKYGERRNE